LHIGLLAAGLSLVIAQISSSAAQEKKRPAPKPREAAETATPWINEPHVQVRLISAGTALDKTAGAARFGLHVRLEPGWKFYWRTPGDAGIAPDFDWSGSVNLAAAEVRWPRPGQWTTEGLATFGYENEVVLPIDILPDNAARSLTANLRLAYGICREVCIPLEHQFSLTLPPGKSRPSPQEPLVQQYAALIPDAAEAVGLGLERVAVVPGAKGPELEIRAQAARPFDAAPDLILEGPEGLAFGMPRATLADDRVEVTWRVPVRDQAGRATLAGLPLTLTILDGGRAVEAMAFIGQE
jgi:suppressor for copper-sensitivity B